MLRAEVVASALCGGTEPMLRPIGPERRSDALLAEVVVKLETRETSARRERVSDALLVEV